MGVGPVRNVLSAYHRFGSLHKAIRVKLHACAAGLDGWTEC